MSCPTNCLGYGILVPTGCYDIPHLYQLVWRKPQKVIYLLRECFNVDVEEDDIKSLDELERLVLDVYADNDAVEFVWNGIPEAIYRVAELNDAVLKIIEKNLLDDWEHIKYSREIIISSLTSHEGCAFTPKEFVEYEFDLKEIMYRC